MIDEGEGRRTQSPSGEDAKTPWLFRKRLQQLRFNFNLTRIVLKFIALQQKRILHALTQRADFGKLNAEVVLSQNAGHEIQQTCSIAC